MTNNCDIFKLYLLYRGLVPHWLYRNKQTKKLITQKILLVTLTATQRVWHVRNRKNKIKCKKIWKEIVVWNIYSMFNCFVLLLRKVNLLQEILKHDRNIYYLVPKKNELIVSNKISQNKTKLRFSQESQFYGHKTPWQNHMKGNKSFYLYCDLVYCRLELSKLLLVCSSNIYVVSCKLRHMVSPEQLMMMIKK